MNCEVGSGQSPALILDPVYNVSNVRAAAAGGRHHRQSLSREGKYSVLVPGNNHP